MRQIGDSVRLVFLVFGFVLFVFLLSRAPARLAKGDKPSQLTEPKIGLSDFSSIQLDAEAVKPAESAALPAERPAVSAPAPATPAPPTAAESPKDVVAAEPKVKVVLPRQFVHPSKNTPPAQQSPVPEAKARVHEEARMRLTLLPGLLY